MTDLIDSFTIQPNMLPF